MMKLKIIRAKPALIEEAVNNFFLQIGSVPGYTISLKNTQLVHIGGADAEEAFVILYNMVKEKDESAPGAVMPTPPGPKGIGTPKGRPHSTPITKP